MVGNLTLQSERVCIGGRARWVTGDGGGGVWGTGRRANEMHATYTNKTIHIVVGAFYGKGYNPWPRSPNRERTG